MQVANYGIGGHYGTHQDPLFLYKEPDYIAKLGDQVQKKGEKKSLLLLVGDTLVFLCRMNTRRATGWPPS